MSQDATYYRLEYADGSGPFAKPRGYIDEDGLRYLRHTMREPLIYRKYPNGIPNAKSWFTAYGYEKYKKWINLALQYGKPKNLQMIVSKSPGQIIMKGKTQIIAKITP